MKQKGFAHLFLILFLVAGLAVAVYLVQKKTNILPKAYEPYNEGIGSTAPMGIGSTSPIGIGSTNPVDWGGHPIPPAKPVKLEGRCDKPEIWITVFQWDPGDSNADKYYVRYKVNNGKWQSSPAIEAKETQNFYQFDTKEAPVLDTWMVIACNSYGGCSDYADGGPFSCNEFFQ